MGEIVSGHALTARTGRLRRPGCELGEHPQQLGVDALTLGPRGVGPLSRNVGTPPTRSPARRNDWGSAAGWQGL